MPDKISVIIPVYNVEKYLRQCLDSVVNQTYWNLEIICVDDGSTDSSGKILDEYAAKDERFVVVHQENQGQSVARNKALTIASGEYILFLDSDDWLDVTLCEKVYQKALETGAERVTYSFYLTNGIRNLYRYPAKMKDHIAYDTADKFDIVFQTLRVVWCSLYKRNLLNSLFFLNTHVLFEDNPYTYQTAYLANKICFLSEPLYYYRTGGFSTGTPQKNRKYLGSLDVIDYVFDIFKNENLSPKAVEQLYYYKYHFLYSNLRKVTNPTVNKELQDAIWERFTPKDWELINNPQMPFLPRARACYQYMRAKYEKKFFLALILKLKWYFFMVCFKIGDLFHHV